MNMKSLWRILSTLTLAAIVLSACGGAPGQKGASETQVAEAALQTLTAMPQLATPPAVTLEPPTPTATLTATPGPTATSATILVGPTGFPKNVNPLTGLTMSDTKLLDRRPAMVKVSNFPASGRPHAGLSSADIVFEYYIGEGMNRFMALFYGQNASVVGPVRSGRIIDAQLVPMYQGILGYSGAYVTILKAITDAIGNRAIMEGACPAVCDDGHGTVTSVFANTLEMTKYAQANGADAKTRPNLDGMRFEGPVPQGGKAGSQVAIIFNQLNRGEWRYDATSGAYLRWIEDANDSSKMIPLTDRNNKKQLSFSNVVVLFAFHNEVASTIFDVTLAGNTTGERALLFRDGQVYDGTWKSNGADKPISFYTKDGKPMALKPGNTWMAIMGKQSGVKEAAGKWEVNFNLP